MAKLFLYSMNISSGQLEHLARLADKKAGEISVGWIENAADEEPGSENWLPSFRAPFIKQGYTLELIDLRNYIDDPGDLKQKLEDKDVIWLGGGNTYYLRWILRASGADEIIKTHVAKGRVYAGWSAGAMVAGPTLEGIEAMETSMTAPELVTEGLNLTDFMVVPHMDNPDFEETAEQTRKGLSIAGILTIPLNDDQVWIVNGEQQNII